MGDPEAFWARVGAPAIVTHRRNRVLVNRVPVRGTQYLRASWTWRTACIVVDANPFQESRKPGWTTSTCVQPILRVPDAWGRRRWPRSSGIRRFGP
jgi:hypothetical protein